MKCIKCDRCGETVPADQVDCNGAALVFTRDSEDGSMGIAYDLCFDCARDLMKWMRDE